jgi:RNA polymerase sigma factor (sigma-70 family)
MANRRGESAFRDIDTLFRLGVVAEMSDGQLLERFAARCDPDGQVAFEAIVRRHGPMVLGVCRRALGDYQAAEDAFQATFLVLALKARAVRKQESLGPWLHGVAARIARRALVLGRQHREVPIPSGGLIDPSGCDPALTDLNAVLDEELDRLPDKYRLPIVLCYLEGKTQEQAALMLGWTKGTVSGRLARAKDLLRRRLSRRGLAPSAGLVAVALAPETASAAVSSPLLIATTRVLVAAVLGGAEAGRVSGSVSSLARAALKWMLVARIVRVTAIFLVMGTAAAAIATPMLISGGPAPPERPVRPTAARGVPAVARPAPHSPAPRVDRYGDPLPDRAQVRLGTIQRRHDKRVVGVEFARDGIAISMQADGLARWWDIKTGQQVGALEVMGEADPDRAITGLSISPDGSILAAAGFAFEPARQRVSHSVWIWELVPRRFRHRLEVDTRDLYSLAFAPDGATIATGGFGGDVQLWDVATGTRRSALKVGSFPVHSLAFAPDGKVLVATAQGSGITLWDLDRNRGTVLPGLKGSWSSPRFSPDGRLLAVPQLGGEIVLRDRTTGVDGLKARGTVIAFAPDSRTIALTGSGDGTLTVLDARTGAERWKSDIGWGSFQAGPAFSPDGQTLIVEIGGVLRLYDADSGRERFGVPEAHQAGVTVVRYAPDGRKLITAGDDGTLREWDAARARQPRVIPLGGPVNLVAISPDGRKLSTGSQLPRASVAVWDLAIGQRVREWSWPDATSSVDALAFSSDGDALLVFGCIGGLKVLEIATGRERPAVQPLLNLAEGPYPGVGLGQAAFSTENRWLAARTATTVHVADLMTGGEQVFPCNAMAFLPDGKGLAMAIPARRGGAGPAKGRIPSSWNAEAIRLVSLASGEDHRIEVPRDLVVALAVSPDGKVLAVAGGRPRPMIRLYRTDDGSELESFAIPAAVNRWGGLAFSPDGRSLAAGLIDTTVMIWNVGIVD